jgi:GNAT superfamily N-acetyltransferase
MAITVRRLVRGEEAASDAFLAQTPESTVFLRSNLARAGLADDGAPFSGTYAGAFDGNDWLVGLAAIFGNANVIVAPGPHAPRVAAHAVALSGKRVGGILGPHEEMVRVRAELSLAHAPTRFTSKEVLYALPLDALVVPEGLASGRVVGRLPGPDEMDELVAWRMQYCAETIGLEDTPATRAEQRRHLEVYQRNGHHFVVSSDERRVAYSAFNASVADLVQIGGVWTPPELRGRGYARCVVAWSLQHARERGARRAVLFTGETNPAAQAAYVAIGFTPIGDYGIVLFA